MAAEERPGLAARALSREVENDEEAVYTDASKNQGTTRAEAVVTTKEKMVMSVSMVVRDVKEAEEVAIALALTLPGKTRIITDSQQACRSFQSGWVPIENISKGPVSLEGL
ncbi:hypothetical protein HPB47_003714 [Ixodes persulcatus]|uniref:Uncharacterized protein n=1 Tax=Ixodes persulcatus TaxID=34615 RepID=A0AC60PIU9_IXOPE|nr:hypothetical protein HPB47_003714 [Ixodes persulcatus]